MDKELAANVVTALQATAEALNHVAATLPPDRRAAVELQTKRLLATKAEVMAALM